MKVKTSNRKIWWYVGNENKPSNDYIKDFKNKMSLRDLRINFVSFEKIEIVLKNFDEITYIWLTHNDQDLYYIITGIRSLNNNSFVLTGELDVWNTFTLPFLNQLKDNKCEVLTNRSHLFDEKSIQFEDELLEGAFKQYQSIDFKKEIFPTKNVMGEECYYNENVAIPVENNINGVFYYVFNDGDNGNYTFIPLLNYKNIPSSVYIGQGKSFINYVVQTQEYVGTTKPNSTNTEYVYEKASIVYQVDDNFTNWIKVNINIDDTIREYINNGNIISYFILKPKDENEINNYTLQNIKDKYELISNSTSLVPSDITISLGANVHNSPRYTTWMWYIDDYISGNNIFSFNYSTRSAPYGMIDFNKFIYTSYLLVQPSSTEQVDFYTKYDINNNKPFLDEIKSSQAWSNKFLGVYFLPNILNLSKLWEVKNINNKNVLICNLSFEMKNINIKLPDIQMEKNYYFNNNIISNKNILKYVMYKYYNNNLPIAYMIDEQNKISLNGKINFTNSGNIYSKYKLKQLNETIFKFPGELPYSIDNYINYVNATKNSANTAYNIVKQNAIKNSVLGIFSGLMSMIPGVGGILGGMTKSSSSSTNMIDWDRLNAISALSNSNSLVTNRSLVPTMGQSFSSIGGGYINSPLTTMFSALQIGQGISSIVSSSVNAGLSVSQFAAKMKAHYADKNNVLGNTINISQDEDAMWILASQDKGQYEFIELGLLTDNAIKNLNNIIYLYGEYYPRIIDINSILSIGEDFSYIQLDAEYLKLNYFYLYNGVRNYFEKVIEELENGVRLIDYDEIIKRELIYWKVPSLSLEKSGGMYVNFNLFYIANWDRGTINIVGNYFNVENLNYNNIDNNKNYIVEFDCFNITFTDEFITQLKRDSSRPTSNINITNGLYATKNQIFKFINVSNKLTKECFNFRNIDSNIKKIYVNGEIWYAR